MQLQPVSITSKAIIAIKEIMRSKNIPEEYGLRIGRENMGSSCGSTQQYALGFDKKSNTDLAYEIDNVPVYIKRQEVLHVNGLELDHVVEGEVSGFLFNKE